MANDYVTVVMPRHALTTLCLDAHYTEQSARNRGHHATGDVAHKRWDAWYKMSENTDQHIFELKDAVL